MYKRTVTSVYFYKDEQTLNVKPFKSHKVGCSNIIENQANLFPFSNSQIRR